MVLSWQNCTRRRIGEQESRREPRALQLILPFLAVKMFVPICVIRTGRTFSSGVYKGPGDPCSMPILFSSCSSHKVTQRHLVSWDRTGSACSFSSSTGGYCVEAPGAANSL